MYDMYMSWNWSRFLLEGNIMFDTMIRDFKFMMDADVIKGFEIDDIRNRFHSEIKEIEKNDKDDIQKALIPWIYKEYESGRLFERSLWKPFRDLEMMTTFLLGYRIMFQYKHYYFQLSLDSLGCNVRDHISGIYSCKAVCFLLTLYGWKDDAYETLQPDNIVCIPSDNMMPEWYWSIK